MKIICRTMNNAFDAYDIAVALGATYGVEVFAGSRVTEVAAEEDEAGVRIEAANKDAVASTPPESPSSAASKSAIGAG